MQTRGIVVYTKVFKKKIEIFENAHFIAFLPALKTQF